MEENKIGESDGNPKAAIDRPHHDLRERTKELGCLYNIIAVSDRHGVALEDVFKEIVGILPEGWQYPDIACSRITYGDREFRTENFAETNLKQSCDIMVDGRIKGRVEVSYLDQCPVYDEGPFLRQERDLLCAVAACLGRIIGRRAEDEGKYRSFFERAVEGMFRTTPEGELVSANPAYAKMCGYSSPEEMIENNLNVGTHIYANMADHIMFQNIIEHRGFVQSFEFPVLKRDGTILLVSLNARAIKDPEGKTVYYEGAIEDITRLKLTEEKLRQSEADYRSFHDNATIGIFRSTPEGQYLRVNPALAAIHGFSSPEEMINTVTNIGEQLYVDPIDRKRYIQLLTKDDTIRGFEAQLSRKDKSKVWIRMNVRAVREADGSVDYYEGMVEDITEKKRIESQLRRAQKMESIGTLAGGIAHDFNNILTSLMGFASLIELKMNKGNPLYPYVKEILLAAGKGADLTKSILAFSRQQSIVRVPVDMNQTIESVHRLLKMLISEDIELSISLTDARAVVMADKSPDRPDTF